MQCIKNMSSINRGEATIKCPICRKVRDINSLPAAFHIIGGLKVIKSGTLPLKDVEGICKDATEESAAAENVQME